MLKARIFNRIWPVKNGSASLTAIKNRLSADELQAQQILGIKSIIEQQ